MRRACTDMSSRQQEEYFSDRLVKGVRRRGLIGCHRVATVGGSGNAYKGKGEHAGDTEVRRGA